MSSRPGCNATRRQQPALHDGRIQFRCSAAISSLETEQRSIVWPDFQQAFHMLAWQQAVANTPAYGLAGLFGTPAGVSDPVSPGCLILAQCCPLTAQRVCSRETTGWRFVPPGMPAAAGDVRRFRAARTLIAAQKRPRLPVDEIPRWHPSGTPARRRRIPRQEIFPVF